MPSASIARAVAFLITRGVPMKRDVRARGSEWLPLQRSIAILRRLLLGPATGEELIGAVIGQLGADAYPPGTEAAKAAFKHDRERLRNQLEARFHYDPVEMVYCLDDAGPFGRLELSPASLKTLALLSQAFLGEIGERAEVQALLEELFQRLSPEDLRKLESFSPAIELDGLRTVDAGPVDGEVWEAVLRAVREHRKLSFEYLSPQQNDRLPRYHEVAPYRIRFQDGHWYLHAYDLYVRNPYGYEMRDAGYRRFRLHYILPGERLVVWPTVLPAGLRKAPRYTLHYRLLPALGRGSVSRRFDDMRTETNPDGSVDVWGTTEDAWQAARTLLGYGENCLVLGGEEVLRLVKKAVQGMARNYGVLGE